MARRRAHRRTVLPMAIDIFAIGETGCNCTCVGGPIINGTVHGCPILSNPTALPGATVQIWQPTTSGTLLASGTTDSSGAFSLSGFSATSGQNLVILIISTGFTNYSITLTYTAGSPTGSQWSPGKTTNTGTWTMSTASGYVCYYRCVQPLPVTLYLSDSQLGGTGVTGITLTYSTLSNTWKGTYTYAFPGCTGCPNPATTTMIYILAATVDYVSVNNSTQISNTCPGPSGGNIPGWDSESTIPSSCSPFALSCIYSIPGGNNLAYAEQLYCTSSATITYTVTP